MQLFFLEIFADRFFKDENFRALMLSTMDRMRALADENEAAFGTPFPSRDEVLQKHLEARGADPWAMLNAWKANPEGWKGTQGPRNKVP